MIMFTPKMLRPDTHAPARLSDMCASTHLPKHPHARTHARTHARARAHTHTHTPGESAAGGRLLHLLNILDVQNVCVVVSRWYGGILLGDASPAFIDI
jgi:hypothetical protein